MKVNNLSDCIKTNLYRISVAKYNRTYRKRKRIDFFESTLLFITKFFFFLIMLKATNQVDYLVTKFC